MEIRINVDDEFLKNLQQKVGGIKATELTRDALTIFNWAVGEVSNGRVILSSNNEGDEIRRLVMPSLDRAEKAKKSD